MKFLILLVLVAVAIYLLVRVIERRGVAGLRHRPPLAPRPVAPDDDDDFLWSLNKRRRRPEDPRSGT